MRKRILPILFACVVCLGILRPFGVQAITPLDPDAEASLTLHYQKEGVAFPELQIGIYRVAEAFPDGKFALIPPFSSYPINIHGITQQTQWTHIASTLEAYIVANQVQPDREMKTDEKGSVCFSDLDTGLYFVREAVAENTSGTYLFNQFLVYVPTPQADGTYTYAVEANPKCTKFIPKTQYTVTKLWQDKGYQTSRPKEIIADIYKDGILYETQILNADNNWSYTWYVNGEETAKWTVSERTVPEAYKVSIRENNGVFSIVNIRQPEPGSPPKTGDSFTPLPWILLLCFSGIMLLILSIYGRRRKV